MLAITLERRRAVINPLGPKTTKRGVVISLLVIWTVCSLIALPPTVFSTTSIPGRERAPPSDPVDQVCIVVWPDGAQGYSQLDF